MNPAAAFIAFTSLSVLMLGILAWRLTSSRSTMMNLLVSSAFLLIAGYYVASGRKSDMNWLPSFLATMLCSGRGIAFLLRSRKEAELKKPALFVTAAALIALAGTVVAYKTAR